MRSRLSGAGLRQSSLHHDNSERPAPGETAEVIDLNIVQVDAMDPPPPGCLDDQKVDSIVVSAHGGLDGPDPSPAVVDKPGTPEVTQPDGPSSRFHTLTMGVQP
jgi:hypothetical protein